MAQPGYGFGPGPSRSTSQWDDRGAGQNRPETDSVALTSSQPDTFGRPASYVDGPSLFPPSSASYDAVGEGVRADASPHSLLTLSGNQAHDSQSLAHYSSTLPHHPPTHYSQYSQPPPNMSHSSQAYQHPHYEHHYHQQALQPPQHHPHYQQHQQQQHNSHQHHLQHAPEQQLGGMQLPSDLMGSHPLGTHQPPHSPYALYHHAESQQGSLDEQQHRAADRAEAAEPHTPRPPNAWILYRSQKFREIQQTREAQTRSGSTEKPKSQAEISRIISQMWANETAAVKEKFEALADEKKLAHQRMYPTYRYRPKKKGKRKQGAGAQVSDAPGSKKAVAYGNYASGSREHDASEGSSSTGHSTERKAGNDILRSSASMHDLTSRELMPRRPGYTDRRERNDLQVPIPYGRSVSGSTSSSEGPSFSYSNNRMHPYGERPSSRLDAFADSQLTPSTYGSSSHWSEADALSSSSGGTYFDGPRSGSTGYAMLGNARPPPAASMLGTPSVGGGSLLTLSPSPSQQPQQPPPARQSVPSQHLQAPIDYLEGGLGLNNMGSTGAGSSFRPAPLTTHHVARFGPTFGESRSEMASGLTIPGGNDGVSEPMDPHRRMQLP
ncbi:probable HMG-box transcription factor [Sporisorium scitamineum]|nr:probable HMG-box transcription factor [Sporisorium scitamineum]